MNEIQSTAREASLNILKGLMCDKETVLKALYTEGIGEGLTTLLPELDGAIAGAILTMPRFDTLPIAELGDKHLKRAQEALRLVWMPDSLQKVRLWSEAVKAGYSLKRQQQIATATLEALEKGKDPQAVMSKALTALNELADGRGNHYLVGRAEMGEKVLEQVHAIETGLHTAYYPTNLSVWDKSLGGIPKRKSRLLIVAGLQGSGKTALASQLAWERASELQASGERGCVVIFSAEMEYEDLLKREAARRARFDVSAWELGEWQASPAELDAYKNAIKELSALKTIEVCDLPSLDPTTIGTVVGLAKSKTNADYVDFLVFDPTLQFIPNEVTKNESVNVDRFYYDLKKVLKRYHCPYMVVAHMNRNSLHRGNPTPTAADLNQAGERAADLLLFITRPIQYADTMDDASAKFYEMHVPTGDETHDAYMTLLDERKACVSVGKNRNGKGHFTMSWKRIEFEGKYFSWQNAERINLNE